MGAFWSVSQGSEEPPALIVMRYEPEGVTDGPVLGLVGKGITFDTGGISIKPADNMEKMKYDMAGGAAMIGAMRAIALLKPKVRVIGIVCAAENMPDGKAQKPGDVHDRRCPARPSKSSTLTPKAVWCSPMASPTRERLGVTHLIDAATLTGACVVALGMDNAGAFSNDDATIEKFQAALATSGEKFWRLPLGDEYYDQIRSDIGDIKNTGGRWGGAITAQSSCMPSPKTLPGFTSTSPAWPGSKTQALHRKGAKRRGSALDPGVGAQLLGARLASRSACRRALAEARLFLARAAGDRRTRSWPAPSVRSFFTPRFSIR